MKRYTLQTLPTGEDGHFLSKVIPGEFLVQGGLSFKPSGFRTHSGDGPDGCDTHIHDDCEVFIILQGKAVMNVDGTDYPLTSGDVIVIEPGEDHHLTADEDDPCVNIWLHAGDTPHWQQDA